MDHDLSDGTPGMRASPDMVPGVVFGMAVLVAMIFGCTLLLPINRADFWRGCLIAWGLFATVAVAVGAFVFLATKQRLMP
jgi:hypothetical protein